MSFEDVFFVLWCIMMPSILVVLYLSGKSVLEQFPDLLPDDKLFEEKRCSGYSGPYSRWNRGARNILNVIITKSEFWIKSHPIHASTIEKTGVLTKISLQNIKEISLHRKRELTIKFIDRHHISEITLRMKRRDEFINILKEKSPQIRRID